MPFALYLHTFYTLITMKPFFETTTQSSECAARTGIMHTNHGDIQTPCFMPVGTQATVKALDNNDLHTSNAQIILGNTYHLHLRPTEDTIAELGGLHRFMNWNGPMLTDSGGFQVFSLGFQKETKEKQGKNDSENTNTPNAKLSSIDENGVTFRSHIDGSEHRFTPEESIRIQKKLGADIIMAFDECTPDDADHTYARTALERTHRWAQESLDAFNAIPQLFDHQQFLFGIIQGANHDDLRLESTKYICDLPFDGIAIGGESIGYNMEATKTILELIEPYIPKDKPRYTMGVGFSPADLFAVVERGVDMFDCVAPTRIARNGALYNKAAGPDKKFRINITNAKFKKDISPIDDTCSCFTCQNHTRAYLNHLFAVDELLGYRLASIHNVHVMLNTMKEIRAAITEDRFMKLKQEWGL